MQSPLLHGASGGDTDLGEKGRRGLPEGKFRILQSDPGSAGRLGMFQTGRGPFPTPAFMPVGTQATVKGLTPEELKDLGVEILLCNAYHLHLRPGEETVQSLGGLHGFMHWSGPILTDSGGFQVFSLSPLRRIGEEGVHFRSHLDGSERFVTPEGAVAIQEKLGTDVAMCLDECIPHTASREYTEASTARTGRWAARCKEVLDPACPMALFGIVQGGMFSDLRRKSAEEMAGIGFDGYALGGLSVGEPPEERLDMVGAALETLPRDAPRYLMGVGSPEDLVTFIPMGIDLFDCVLPTRCARNGTLFTRKGRLDIRHAEHARSALPVEEDCGCYTCLNYSRAYLRHLYQAKEILAARLHTIHNVYYYMDLIRGIRGAIQEGRVDEFQRAFYRERSSTDSNSLSDGRGK